MFGVLIALLAVMQTQAIPAANEQVEYNHHLEVQSDLVGFHEASSSVARTGDPQTVNVQMGTTYPSRLLFFNPGNPSGEIRTTERRTASIQNVRATDDVTRKYIDGSITGLRTKRLEYRPNYNEYQNAPTTVVEYGGVYRDFGYDVEDNGGAGLDYIEVGVTNSSGGIIINSTHNLVGAQDNGTFYTPQMIPIRPVNPYRSRYGFMAVMETW
ncbi:hypothetical protein [Natronomonas sp.]|uniref:hypothetical protein n=1 Tax=Natronomonas sp. TaxID=2184060 RepID=UPI002FC39843